MHDIHTMTLDDCDVVIELMKRTPGVSVRGADSRESTDRYLQRKPNLSFVCEAGKEANNATGGLADRNLLQTPHPHGFIKNQPVAGVSIGFATNFSIAI